MRADVKALAIDVFHEIAARHRFTIHEFEVMEDHTHLFIAIRPSQSISQIMLYLKGVSSRKLREVFPELKAIHREHLWSSGKYFRPIRDVSIDAVTHYIRKSQRKHHNDPNRSRWLEEKELEERTPQQSTLDAFVS